MSVIFDQLRISDDGKRMYINAHVNKACYFDDIYLDSITIMTSDKVSETNPHIPTSDYIYNQTFKGESKCLDLVLTVGDFLKTWETEPDAMKFKASDMSTTLFFIYIKVKGTPDQCTPCRLDEEVTVGVTFDESLLYQRVMDYTKSLSDTCQIPNGFTDFILLWNAFKASIETEHFIPAIKFYNMLFGNYDERYSRDGSHSPFGGMGIGRTKPAKPCNCHG